MRHPRWSFLALVCCLSSTSLRADDWGPWQDATAHDLIYLSFRTRPADGDQCDVQLRLVSGRTKALLLKTHFNFYYHLVEEAGSSKPPEFHIRPRQTYLITVPALGTPDVTEVEWGIDETRVID